MRSTKPSARSMPRSRDDMGGENIAEPSLLTRLLRDAPVLSAGVMAADLSNLASELRIIESAGVDLVHIDVMDGVFCTGLTVGPPVIAAIKTPS